MGAGKLIALLNLSFLGFSFVVQPGKWGMPEKNIQNAVQKSLSQVADAPQSKVMAKAYFRQLCPMYSALQNRWSLKLNEGAIFVQSTYSNICSSIKM